MLNAGGWDKNIIENPKLLVRQTADTIIVAYDEDGLYHLNNVHSFAPDNEKWNIKYILAILNSKVIRWYYEILANEKGRPMPQTDIETLETLPIKYREDCVDDIVKLVEKIINDYDNKEVYISELDEKIFEIYGLNDNEKNIIKKYFRINKSERKTEDIVDWIKKESMSCKVKSILWKIIQRIDFLLYNYYMKKVFKILL